MRYCTNQCWPIWVYVNLCRQSLWGFCEYLWYHRDHQRFPENHSWTKQRIHSVHMLYFNFVSLVTLCENLYGNCVGLWESLGAFVVILWDFVRLWDSLWEPRSLFEPCESSYITNSYAPVCERMWEAMWYCQPLEHKRLINIAPLHSGWKLGFLKELEFLRHY